MLRALLPETVALVTSGAGAMAMLVRLDFAPPVLACSGMVEIEFGGDTYRPTGDLGAIEPIRDAAGAVSALAFALSGASDEAVGLALNHSARGKRARVWAAVCRASDWGLVQAVQVFDGALDQMPLQVDKGSSSIVATGLHMATIFDRPRPLRYTDADQLAAAPGDTCGRFLVAQSQTKDVWPASTWGRQ